MQKFKNSMDNLLRLEGSCASLPTNFHPW